MTRSKKAGTASRAGVGLLTGALILLALTSLLLGNQLAARPVQSALQSAPTAQAITLKVFVPCGTLAPASQAFAAFTRTHPGIIISPVVDKGKPLAKRLQTGGKADVFIGRPEDTVPLLKEGLLDPKAHAVIADHILSLVTLAENPAQLRSLADLTSPRLRTLAIGPPKSHPGKYTRQALKKLGLVGRIRARQIIIPEDAEMLPTLLGRGDVQAAILFRSCMQTGADAKGRPIIYPKFRLVADLPASSHDEIALSAAVAKHSAHPAQARLLVDFLATPQARQFFLKSGFRAPAAR